MSEHMESVEKSDWHIVRAQYILAIIIVVAVPSLILADTFLPLHSGSGSCHLNANFCQDFGLRMQ